MTTTPPSDAGPLVRARHLTKRFNHLRAVDEISFDINAGEVVGFLGPNGAGKTTTIRMLINLLDPTSGDLLIFGRRFATDRAWILAQMNASSSALALPGKLTVFQNLRIFADFYHVRRPAARIETMLERFDLVALKDRHVLTLSSGQQVRLSLAKALLNRPRLLLLDEPTANLDPDVADRARGLLLDAVRDEGVTVFLTSHNMLEVEKVCTRVLFINEGRIQAEGTPRELARRVKRWRVSLKCAQPLRDIARLELPEHAKAEVEENRLHVEMDREEVGPFLTRLVNHGVAISAISIHEPTLEDFFVQTSRQGNAP